MWKGTLFKKKEVILHAAGVHFCVVVDVADDCFAVIVVTDFDDGLDPTDDLANSSAAVVVCCRDRPLPGRLVCWSAATACSSFSLNSVILVSRCSSSFVDCDFGFFFFFFFLSFFWMRTFCFVALATCVVLPGCRLREVPAHEQDNEASQRCQYNYDECVEPFEETLIVLWHISSFWHTHHQYNTSMVWHCSFYRIAAIFKMYSNILKRIKIVFLLLSYIMIDSQLLYCSVSWDFDNLVLVDLFALHIGCFCIDNL